MPRVLLIPIQDLAPAQRPRHPSRRRRRRLQLALVVGVGRAVGGAAPSMVVQPAAQEDHRPAGSNGEQQASWLTAKIGPRPFSNGNCMARTPSSLLHTPTCLRTWA